MRVAVVLALAAGSAFGQTPQAAPLTARGSISGVVRDESTGKPMAEVEVGVRRPPAKAVTTKTDTEGRYTLRGLEPGSYTLAATTRAGGGVGVPTYATRPVTLQAGQEVTGIDFLLRPPCVISGKVVDENGEPLAGIGVFLVAREYSFGALRLVLAGGSTTDDQGGYALGRTMGRVGSGRAYLVLAQKRETKLPAVSDAPDNPKLRRRVPVPTYYPDARTPEEAQSIVLRVGEHRENADIRMWKSQSYCVEGILTGPGGPADLNFEIKIQQPTSGASGDGAFYRSEPGGTLGGRGEVRICDLHPGDYELSVSKRLAFNPSGPELFESTRVTITDQDLAGLRLAARPGIPVEGEVAFDGPAPEQPLEAELSLDLRSITRTVYPSAKSSLPGKFSFPGLPLDEYSVQMRGLPDGLYVKDLTYGGRSISGKSLRVGSAVGEASLRVVVGRDGSSVSARVTDRDGNAVGNCHVILLPASAGSEAELAAAMQSGQTDQTGAWTSGTLAPGKYYALASHAPVDRSPEDIGRLWRARLRAQEINLGAGTTAQVKLEPRGLE